MKIIRFLKKCVEVVGVLLVLFSCWTAAFFITPWVYDVLSITGLSSYITQMINFFFGFFLFGLCMFGISQIRLIQERQTLFIRPMVDAMKNIAQGNFNIDLSPIKAELDRRQPFNGVIESIQHKIIESIQHMAKELGQMEQMRQDFISNVSHEFQSPLTSISGFAHALKSEQLSKDERLQYLQVIEEESMRLSKLSHNLLKLTSLESDHPPFDPKTYRLDQQLRRVILSNEPLWRNKDIEFDVTLDNVSIHADEDLLEQVWINLIHNSIKFTPNKGIISVQLKKKFANRIAVVIKDTGIGMTKEVQMHIFERFYRADPSRNRSSGGNGLGLAIVKNIIDLHKGEIRVESAPEEGTEFTVILPVSQNS